MLRYYKNRIDQRQQCFLFGKSCGTQREASLTLSLNQNTRSDVVYFDFAKAFYYVIC